MGINVQKKKNNNIRSNVLKIAWLVTALAAIILLVVYYGRLEELYKHDRTTGTALAATDISSIEKTPESGNKVMAEIVTPEPAKGGDKQGSQDIYEKTDENPQSSEAVNSSDGTETGTEISPAGDSEPAPTTAPTTAPEPTIAPEQDNEAAAEPEIDLSDEPDSEGSLAVGDEEGIDPYKPMIAFSFDDGPSKYTKRILATLAEYGARATFFMVGYNVEKNADIVQMVYDAGCEVANHTMDHKDLANSKKSVVVSQVEDNPASIESIVPVGGMLVRPPYGSYNKTTKSLVKYPMICWSVDSLDWKTRNADSIEKQILNDVRDGYIVLMHDLYDTTAEATERVIPKLIEQGYQIVTVSELFAARGEALEAGHVYRMTITAEELMEKEAAEKAKQETE